MTRSSNTITDLIPGATVQLLQADPAGTATGQGTNVTVSIARDPNGIGSKAQALVTALNGVFSEVDLLTSYDQDQQDRWPAASATAGRVGLSNDLLSAMDSVVGSGKTVTLAQIGIQIQRDGTYTFDSNTAGQPACDRPHRRDQPAEQGGAGGSEGPAGRDRHRLPRLAGSRPRSRARPAKRHQTCRAASTTGRPGSRRCRTTYTKQYTALDVAVVEPEEPAVVAVERVGWHRRQLRPAGSRSTADPELVPRTGDHGSWRPSDRTARPIGRAIAPGHAIAPSRDRSNP